MRLHLSLVAESKNIILPKSFNHIIQALIYNNLDTDHATWLHNEGYDYHKRVYKLFTFSSILARPIWDKKRERFIFPRKISFFISSPLAWILEEFAQRIQHRDFIMLGRNKVFVSSCEIQGKKQIVKPKIRIKTLSPIEVHRTEGNKTVYKTPFEEEFSALINDNLRRKWESLYRNECPHTIRIRPLFTTPRNEKNIYVGGDDRKVRVKAWIGEYELEGNPEFLTFAYEASLGGKNSQGFGMFQIVD